MPGFMDRPNGEPATRGVGMPTKEIFDTRREGEYRYSDDQPRDDGGRFGSGGGGDSGKLSGAGYGGAHYGPQDAGAQGHADRIGSQINDLNLKVGDPVTVHPIEGKPVSGTLHEHSSVHGGTRSSVDSVIDVRKTDDSVERFKFLDLQSVTK